MEGKGTKEADQAIRDASVGKISVPDMIKKITDAQVFVPLAAPPVIAGDKMKSWQPATVSHHERGDYLLAFTDKDCRNAFAEKSPEYKFGLFVETKFLMTVLPPNHGILFNMGGESCFEWDCKGIFAYQQTMAIKNPPKQSLTSKKDKTPKKK